MCERESSIRKPARLTLSSDRSFSRQPPAARRQIGVITSRNQPMIGRWTRTCSSRRTVPPGRITRRASASAHGGEGTVQSPSATTRGSNDPARNGSASASHHAPIRIRGDHRHARPTMRKVQTSPGGNPENPTLGRHTRLWRHSAEPGADVASQDAASAPFVAQPTTRAGAASASGIGWRCR
jgi:hypothetical protein